MQPNTIHFVPSDIATRIGKRVRELRLKIGWSQEELAGKAKMHRTYVGMIERGEKNITIKNAEKLATAFNIPISSLFDDART